MIDSSRSRRLAMPEPMSRTAPRRRVLDDAGCERVVGVYRVIGRGDELFDFVRALDDQGVVSMRDLKSAILAVMTTTLP
jgi:hypothetical protein